jgi:hypothetical protein
MNNIKNNWNNYQIIVLGKIKHFLFYLDFKNFFRFSDDTQRETKFKELELENERNKQVLTARIKQLQSEIDLLVKEKKNSNYLYVLFRF